MLQTPAGMAHERIDFACTLIIMPGTHHVSALPSSAVSPPLIKNATAPAWKTKRARASCSLSSTAWR
jgi:hypothetical protein